MTTSGAPPWDDTRFGVDISEESENLNRFHLLWGALSMYYRRKPTKSPTPRRAVHVESTL